MNKKPIIFWNGEFVDFDGETRGINRNGTSLQRPNNPSIGFQYFDTTLNKPIWWNGNKWVDSTGITV